MKCNVKGLVFVGFAAAILSANAMAATGDEKIVTSKAFTEATYQKLSNLTTQGSATGNILSTDNAADAKYPSEKAVATAIAATTNNANGRQTASTTNFQVGGANGAWNQIGTDSYVNVAAGTGANDGKAMFTINATTDGTLPAADSAKLVTAGAVKTYADNKIAASITDGDETHAPSGDAVNDALALKQNASTAVKYAGSAVGSATTPVYVDANGDVTASTYTIETSVPANAVFTDTKYSDMTGADATTAGTSGLVPAPAAGDNTKFLNGAGEWATPENTTYDTLTAEQVTTGTDTTGKLVTAKILRDELNNKVTKNSNITAGTATKITYDEKGLVTGGASLQASDIPDISATYQLVQLGDAKVGGADSVDKDKLVYLDADGKIAKSGMTVTSSVTNNNTNPVTSGAVYSYVNGKLIPTATGCSASTPCALVATGESTFNWVAMSQPSAQ